MSIRHFRHVFHRKAGEDADDVVKDRPEDECDQPEGIERPPVAVSVGDVPRPLGDVRHGNGDDRPEPRREEDMSDNTRHEAHDSLLTMLRRALDVRANNSLP